jgi:hypothetical protein
MTKKDGDNEVVHFPEKAEYVPGKFAEGFEAYQAALVEAPSWKSPKIDQLAVALAKAQAAIEPAIKDSKNPHFGSKYADLAAVWSVVREPLAANGLAVVQMPSAEGQKVTLTTLLIHTSGQYLLSELTMTAVKNDPQAIGSCITYARRYALAAVLGVSQEDDDGAAATATGTKPAAPAPTKGRASHGFQLGK